MTFTNDRIVRYKDASYDAFSRLRTSNPYTLFQVSHNTNIRSHQIASKTANGGTETWQENESCVDMAVTTTASSQVIRQSRPYITYQPGKSLCIMCTGVLNANSNGVDCDTKIGLFDDRNGVYFTYANGLSVVLRSYVGGSVVNTSVAQASWNIDVMDGDDDSSNPSGINLDASKTQIFMFDLEWLGIGRVRVGIVQGGSIYYVHEFLNANVQTTAYMTRATLPIRYQIDNTATTNGAGTLKMICMTAISEGGFEAHGYPSSSGLVDNDEITVGTTILPIVSIRLKSGDYTHKRVLCKLLCSQIMCISSANMVYFIYHYLSPAASPLTGGSWADVGSHSSMEVNKTATAINTTDAHVMYQGYFSNNTDFDAKTLERTVSITSDVDANTDYIVLAAQKIGTGTDDVLGALVWTEFTT